MAPSDNNYNGCTLDELMLSLASMTGNLSGGVTLAGGNAAEAGDRVVGLPLRATGARRHSVSEDIRRRTCLIQDGGGAPVSFRTVTSSSLLDVAYVPAATMRGAYPLLHFRARVCGVDLRAAILAHSTRPQILS